MLRKWIKKRLKGSKKNGDPALVEGKVLSPPSSPPRKQQQKSGSLFRRSSNKNRRSPGRSSKYKNIEKEESRLSYSQPFVTSIVGTFKPDTLLPPEKESSSLSLASHTRIPPPPSSVSPSRIHNKNKNEAPILTPEEYTTKKKDFKEVPLIRIRPIDGPPDRQHPPRQDLVEAQEEIPPPSSLPPSDRFARDLSYTGTDVASPPSIDTALFKGEYSEVDNASYMAEHSSPPTIIKAVLPIKSGLDDADSPSPPRGINSKPRPLPDDDFFTARMSQSGTGSLQLNLWLEEVKKSIGAQQNPKENSNGNTTSFDDEKEQVQNSEEKQHQKKEPKDRNSGTDVGTTRDDLESLKENQNMIENSLKESIEKSKSRMSAIPKGILKSKTIEPGTIKDGSNVSETSLGDPNVSDDAAMVGTETSPIKVFSKSRRQRLQRGYSTEDETSDSVSPSISSDSEVAYENLHQLNPTVSRDETQKSQGSMQFFYNKICNVSGLMEGYEDDLCQFDDISITDDTITSRSTISKDSYLAHGGWMCFDAF